MLQVSAPFPSSVGGVNLSAPPTANAIPGQAGTVAPGFAIPSNQQTNAAVPSAGNTSQPDTDAQSNNTETPTRGEYGKSKQGQPQETEEEQKQTQELVKRDRQVRSHEAAHAAAGGRYTRGASFTYRRGPDGRLYAIGGEVKIDTAPVPGNPQATLQKAETIRAAALAPANPSNQDRQVAMNAAQIAIKARQEIQQQRQTENTKNDNVRPMHSRIAAYFKTQPPESPPGSNFAIAV